MATIVLPVKSVLTTAQSNRILLDALELKIYGNILLNGIVIVIHHMWRLATSKEKTVFPIPWKDNLTTLWRTSYLCKFLWELKQFNWTKCCALILLEPEFRKFQDGVVIHDDEMAERWANKYKDGYKMTEGLVLHARKEPWNGLLLLLFG